MCKCMIKKIHVKYIVLTHTHTVTVTHTVHRALLRGLHMVATEEELSHDHNLCTRGKVFVLLVETLWFNRKHTR